MTFAAMAEAQSPGLPELPADAVVPRRVCRDVHRLVQRTVQPAGMPCSLPDDDLYYCTWTPEGELSATRYFTSSALTQNSAVALTRKAGTLDPYQRDAAKRRIPRRCPART